MYVPVVKKLIFKENVLVERALPNEGSITVSVEDAVEPSDKIGTCKVIYEIVELGEKFKVSERNEEGSNYYANETLVGSVGRDKFYAPFGGFLEKTDAGYIFKSEERDYWLLPGVWGVVKDISQNRSVLVKTQTVDVHLPMAGGLEESGEMIVFPNPSEFLTMQYFNNYIKSAEGKIVYVGNNITLEIVKSAKELKLTALLAGSASKEAYDFAMEQGISVGLFVGFGDINTPDNIYNFINEISSRYVFLYTKKNVLQVPVPLGEGFEENRLPGKIIKYVRKGMEVQVLNSANFGQMGTVDRVTKSGILVKLHENNQEIQVKPPNLLIIE